MTVNSRKRRNGNSHGRTNSPHTVRGRLNWGGAEWFAQSNHCSDQPINGYVVCVGKRQLSRFVFCTFMHIENVLGQLLDNVNLWRSGAVSEIVPSHGQPHQGAFTFSCILFGHIQGISCRFFLGQVESIHFLHLQPTNILWPLWTTYRKYTLMGVLPWVLLVEQVRRFVCVWLSISIHWICGIISLNFFASAAKSVQRNCPWTHVRWLVIHPNGVRKWDSEFVSCSLCTEEHTGNATKLNKGSGKWMHTGTFPFEFWKKEIDNWHWFYFTIDGPGTVVQRHLVEMVFQWVSQLRSWGDLEVMALLCDELCDDYVTSLLKRNHGWLWTWCRLNLSTRRCVVAEPQSTSKQEKITKAANQTGQIFQISRSRVLT